MKTRFVLILLAFSLNAAAQDATVKDLKASSDRTITKDPTDTATKTWKKGGLAGINLSQGSLNNWAAGGDNFSLSLNAVLSLYGYYKKGRHSWDNTLDFNLGYVNTTSLGSRKNDDRIDILSKYGYALNSKWDVGGLINFRSQFFKGYSYSDASKTLSSNFLSPGYLLLSPGVDYKPNKDLSFFISPATVRFTFVQDDTLSAHGDYGVTPGKHLKTEIGAFASVTYAKDFNKIVSYKGRLDLFSNYQHNPQNVDIYFTNLLNVKLSKVFSLTWSVDMIYDDDVRLFGKNNDGAALQLKSLVGFGMLAKF